MKNTFKILSCVTAGVAFLVASQPQASAVGNTFVPVPFSPLVINGTGVGSLASTNAGVVTYSAKNFTLNNAFILAEFYASDYAKNNNLSSAVGDSLAIANAYQTYVTSVITGYRKLNSGQVIPIYGLSTNRLVAPYGQNVYSGDVVILNSLGQVKTDLTRIGVIPSLSASWNNYQGVYVGNAYSAQGSATGVVNLTFGGVPETLTFDLFGGGNFSSSTQWYGILLLNGGGVGHMSNPADAALLNGTIVFTKISASVPHSL
jgi:hypothetical protein